MIGAPSATSPTEFGSAASANHLVAPIILLPVLLTLGTLADKELKPACAQVLLGQLECEGKVFTRGRPVVSLATINAAKLSTWAVGSVVEIGGAVASVAAKKGQCLDTVLKEGSPGGKGGLMLGEDESSSDQVD